MGRCRLSKELVINVVELRLVMEVMTQIVIGRVVECSDPDTRRHWEVFRVDFYGRVLDAGRVVRGIAFCDFFPGTKALEGSNNGTNVATLGIPLYRSVHLASIILTTWSMGPILSIPMATLSSALCSHVAILSM